MGSKHQTSTIKRCQTRLHRSLPISLSPSCCLRRQTNLRTALSYCHNSKSYDYQSKPQNLWLCWHDDVVKTQRHPHLAISIAIPLVFHIIYFAHRKGFSTMGSNQIGFKTISFNDNPWHGVLLDNLNRHLGPNATLMLLVCSHLPFVY